MKRNEIIIVCGFVLISLIVGIILGYYWMPKDNAHKEFTEIDINNSVVQKLYQIANPSDDYTSLEGVYSKKGFSNEFILGSAFVNFLREHPNNTAMIAASNIDTYVKKIFGNVSYTHESGQIISNELCSFVYDVNEKGYDYKIGCGGNQSYKILRKIVSARKSDDEYIIQEKSIVTYNSWLDDADESYTYVYNDVAKTKELAKLKNNDKNTLDIPVHIDTYLADAATYEYHFVFDGENFVYKSLEKI